MRKLSWFCRIDCEFASAAPAGWRERLRADYLHHVWAIDIQFDQTMDGRRLKFRNVLDELSRVCLAIWVSRRCLADDVAEAIEELLRLYPPPIHLRMDNSPEFIADALQERCPGSGTSTAYIEPDSPWEDQFLESFNSCFRDEFLLMKSAGGQADGRAVADGVEYNTCRLPTLRGTGSVLGYTSRGLETAD